MNLNIWLAFANLLMLTLNLICRDGSGWNVAAIVVNAFGIGWCLMLGIAQTCGIPRRVRGGGQHG